MKGTQIILDHMNGREAAALMIDGKLQDFLALSDTPRPGTIYRAIADRPVKGQGGMFLRTADGPAFLRQGKGLSPGQTILVQVTGFAEDGKAIPVSQKVLFKSRYAIVTPGAPGRNISRSIRDDDMRDSLLCLVHDLLDDDETMGLILRSSCEGGLQDAIVDDIEATLSLARQVMADAEGSMEVLIEGDTPHAEAWREWADPADIVTDAGGFETHGVIDALEELRDISVSLGAGASIAIEPTRALVAVDVNTGRDTSPAAGLKANMATARELPRQLRLRGLGGQITIDLAPMPKKDRRIFESALKTAFRRDTIDTTLVGFTPLGHFELQRKNARIPLNTLLK
ncbi:ribonuclease E/G [Pseudopelagicola sp. nBUS_20]|uniref:ribonuclease E/G n=1 Tax=Pseudopelagicola sp. nBUS_20 TaxID=3395317 RepID=UPI003EBDBA04